jgi:transposase
VSLLVESNAKLEARILELERQIAQNSQNSSKPPSTDGNRKVKSLRKKGERRPGGQPGHAGKTLEASAAPDAVVKHEVVRCDKCATDLSSVLAATVEKRQVFDVPKPTIYVTEHQAERKTCPCCGEEARAVFPEGVTAAVQYGEGVKAIASYLHGYQLLPYARACELMFDLYGVSLSEGTLANAMTTLNNQVESSVSDIKAKLEAAQLAHFDETGVSIEGERKWLHVACTDSLTYYGVHDKRGSEATDDIGILPKFLGLAMHDHWKPYFIYDCKHALCNAHHLRELTFVAEEFGQDWANAMKECLLDIKATVDQRRETADCLAPHEIREFEARYRRVIAQAQGDNPLPDIPVGEKPKRGRRKKTKPRNLLERLDNFQTETLAFMYDFSVPFDNNQAERDIRMAKVKQKISGTFRSWHGAAAFARIRSYVSTARKQGQAAFQALRNAFAGKPFYARA